MDRQSKKFTALYIRVDKGSDTYEHILHQQELLTQYASSHGLEKIKIFSDVGFSGTSFDRPGFQQMMREIEAGHVAHVVVSNYSRLAQSAFCLDKLMKRVIHPYGADLISMKDGRLFFHQIIPDGLALGGDL